MKMLKQISVLFLAFCLAACLAPAASQAAPVAGMTLTITGDGVEWETVFTYDKLISITGQISGNAYSAWNTWPSEKTYYAQGVSLAALLELAGLKDNAVTINIAAAPDPGAAVGYNATFLVNDLLGDRYTFAGGGKTRVPPIIALKLSEKDLNSLEDVDLRLIYGQVAAQEQTTAGFVQSVRVITVSCDPARQLPQPQATAKQLANGQYEVTLASSNVNAKVYYTTDGSTPSPQSKMYNLSAAQWQPQLNVPFTVSGDAQIKAVAIASGYSNSEVLSFTAATLNNNSGGVISINGADNMTGGFKDVPADYWAADAIGALTQKNIIAGMGSGMFAPEQTLTRAQFATMMVLTISGSEPLTAGESQFNDVAQGAWYADYVAEGVRLGLFVGYADGGFHPGDPVTKEQMLTVAVRALPGGEDQAEGSGGTLSAAEWASSWARGFVEYAYINGLVAPEMLDSKSGIEYLDGTKAGIRAEAAYVVNKMIEILQ